MHGTRYFLLLRSAIQATLTVLGELVEIACTRSTALALLETKNSTAFAPIDYNVARTKVAVSRATCTGIRSEYVQKVVRIDQSGLYFAPNVVEDGNMAPLVHSRIRECLHAQYFL